ncbi:MAG TPA: GNAT family N-acetyltransferase [Phenylobacterium sp.]
MQVRLLAVGDEDLLVAAALTADEEIGVRRAARLLADESWIGVTAIDEEPVGLAYGHVLKLLEGDSLLLYSIDVAEPHRRRGAGRAMIEALKDVCRERDLFEMWVLTNRANGPAMRLYSSAGGYEEHPDVVMFEWPAPDGAGASD